MLCGRSCRRGKSFWFFRHWKVLHGGRSSTQSLGEFQGYEFGWVGACVGEGVGVVAGEPFGFAGFEVAGQEDLGSFFVALDVGLTVAVEIAAEVQVGDGDQEVRAGVVVRGDYAAGLEFEFGGADSVFDEDDLLRAAG